MNRRGFIGTLTALAGLTLAKIKAPAAADEFHVERVSPWVWDERDLNNYFQFRNNGKTLFIFKGNKIYALDSSGEYREWKTLDTL